VILAMPAITTVLLALAWTTLQLKRAPSSGSSMTQHAGPTLREIQSLAELVTARAIVADAQETTLAGKTGSVTAILVVRGEVLLGPDLGRARIVAVDEKSRSLTIELPRPRVISARLDHRSTRIAAVVHEGLWTIVPGDAGRTRVLNEAYAQAEAALAAAAADPSLVDVASHHTEQVMAGFFATGGWKVSVRWAAPP
jgi:hypothetical protein